MLFEDETALILWETPGAGIALCIESALAQSGVAREDVNYVNAHATSTQSGDLKEYQALVRCFGNNPEVINLRAPKKKI